MKQLVLWLLVGLSMCNCSKSSPAPTLVGTWEMTSRRVVTLYTDGRPTEDETNRPPLKHEYFADGRYTYFFGTASSYTTGGETYTYAGGVLTHNTSSGPYVQTVTELSDHRMVLIKRNVHPDGTADYTFTWQR